MREGVNRERPSTVFLAAKTTCTSMHIHDLRFFHPVSVLTLAKYICSCYAS